jgi:hypothetical protein
MVKKAFTTLKRAAVALGFLLSVVVVVGLIVYLLYRVAVFDKETYALLFYGCSAALFTYFVYRALRRHTLIRVVLRVLRVLLVMTTVCGVVFAYALLGGLIVRRPFVGIPVTLPILFASFYLLPKLNLSFLSGEDSE